MPIVRQIEASGVTGLHGIAAALNDRGIRTARGGAWHNSQCAIYWRGRRHRRLSIRRSPIRWPSIPPADCARACRPDPPLSSPPAQRPQDARQAPSMPAGDIGLPQRLGCLACSVPFTLQDIDPSAQAIGARLGLIGASSEPVDLRRQPVALGLECADLAGMGLAEVVDHGLRLSDCLGGVHTLLMRGQLLLQRLDALAQGIGPGAFGGGRGLGLACPGPFLVPRLPGLPGLPDAGLGLFRCL
jgi:hypothetical protein